MSILKKVEDFVENVPSRVEEGIHDASQMIEGFLDPDYRHDDPAEKARDRIRTEIDNSHRFQSFADMRHRNFVKWHIDGHDFFYAVSEMIDSAREVIMILDWWLTPELYLRRPPALHPEWRLDRLLKRKAEQGVKVYVIVYKEVPEEMTMSSHHTKEALEALHENIACMRHPDHIGSRNDVEFWSHHEKVVIVDNHRASIGGLDLCFGRWDSHNHQLADVHPTKFARTLFPGQDYNNARLLDFQQVENYVSNQLSILEAPRMPWHDVHMTLVGPAVLDIVQHFVERWNEIKKRKYKDGPTASRYDWLALPHDVALAPNEAVLHHPQREQWHETGRHFRQRFQIPPGGDEEDDAVYGRAPHGAMDVQVVRSVSDWSHGVLTEKSVQTAYCQLIADAQHFIYIENQFFISNTQTSGPVKNVIAKALVERIVRAGKEGQKFKVVVIIPEVPAFAGQISDDTSIKTILAAQWRTINRGGHSICEEVSKAGFDPSQYIRFYHLRSYDRINAPYPSYISEMEKRSGVTFLQAQVAQARLWLGESYGQPDVQKTVAIKIPQKTQEGLVETSEESNKKVEQIPLPLTLDEARDILRRFEHGADGIRGDEDVADSVAQHTLGDRTGLLDEKWLGTEEEERAAYVSELLYIHAKVMIVDDRRVIMGSANLNDRSQKGDGDSEIALVVEDTDEIESTMDGQQYMATRFAASLRRKLYREHLGLIPPQNVSGHQERVDTFMRPAPHANEDETRFREDALVADPLSDQVIDLWQGTAKRNRDIFTEVFRPVPSDFVRTWDEYKKYIPKVKAGHVVPGISLDRVKKQLSQVRGSLVEMPLQFLIEEKELVDNPDWLGLNPLLPIYI